MDIFEKIAKNIEMVECQWNFSKFNPQFVRWTACIAMSIGWLYRDLNRRNVKVAHTYCVCVNMC